MMNQPTSFIARAVVLAIVFWGAAASAADTPPASQPVDQAPVMLRAGPIQLKFANGELRYLHVGDREIIRRIYFAVREATMGTDLPTFSELRIEPAADHFHVHLAAACGGKTISYQWTADITGSADGTIEYRISGEAPADGTSGRIGLCVLYGAAARAGHPFELLDKDGHVTAGQWPQLVSPTLVGKQFYTLRYVADGLKVQCGIAESPFDMEDQRNYGDTSFKAYNPMPYAYPKVPKGVQMTETLTLSAQESAPATQPDRDLTTHIKVGKPLQNVQIPAIGSRDNFKSAVAFVAVNQHRDQFKDSTAVTWLWTTATHLPDDDVVMENLPAIVDQARTVKSFLPRALLRVGPISMNGRWPDFERPPGYAAAWTADAIKYLAMGNVDESAFTPMPPEAERIISLFQTLTGKPLLDVQIDPAPAYPNAIDAFAATDIGTTSLWIINRSAQSQHVAVDDLPPGSNAKVHDPITDAAPQPLAGGAADLGPYEVRQVVFSSR